MTTTHGPGTYQYEQDVKLLNECGLPYSWVCVDCGMDTAPGNPSGAETAQAIRDVQAGRREGFPFRIGANSEVYAVRPAVWARAKLAPDGGCLCIGCLEKRIGRRLKPKDFPPHGFNDPQIPGTKRLRNRRGF